MELKDILNLIDRFEQSASVSMTIKLGDDELSLKKAEAYAPKTETIVAPQPARREIGRASCRERV